MGHCFGRQPDAGRVPRDRHVRDVVGDFRNEEGRAHTGHTRDLSRHVIQPVLPLLPQRVVIFIEIKIQCLDHADNFFLAYFLATADGILVRAVVKQCVCNQIFSADQQTGALWSAHRFTATEGYEVIAHIRIIPKM